MPPTVDLPRKVSPAVAIQVVVTLLAAVKKDKLREDLTKFVQILRSLIAACGQRHGQEPVTKEINGLCEELCCLSRRILFGIWPEDDGIALTDAVIKLFLVAADHVPDSTPEFPLLSDFRANIRLRAEDLQPYACTVGS